MYRFPGLEDYELLPTLGRFQFDPKLVRVTPNLRLNYHSISKLGHEQQQLLEWNDYFSGPKE
jgi:hypothetical protein